MGGWLPSLTSLSGSETMGIKNRLMSLPLKITAADAGKSRVFLWHRPGVAEYVRDLL